MKSVRFIFLIITCGQFLQSCDNVLERQPLDKILESDVWRNESLIQAYVANLYSRFPFFAFETSGWYNLTDEGTVATGNSNSATNGTISRSAEINGYWDYSYIRDCNVFLENVPASPIAEAIKQQLAGEVRFIRAYAYFEMMKRYGGVPLVDVVLDPFSPVDKKYMVRATEESVARFIEAELDAAAGLLTDNPLPKGRVNKWTALALKARSMLWAASIARYGNLAADRLTGIPRELAGPFYQKAEEAADEIIRSGAYALYEETPADKAENYRNIFINESNSEVIFEKPYDGINIGHAWDDWQAPPQWAALRGGTGNPTLDFILGYENIDGSADQPVFSTGGNYILYENGREPFQKKDPRLFATVFFQEDPWGGGRVETYEGLDPGPAPNPSAVIRSPNTSYENVPAVGADARVVLSTNSGFLIKKYIDDRAAKIPDGQSKTNWIVFRLAEIYLTKAEAAFELGELAEAATALNKTRQRAGISLVDDAGISLDIVRTERRSELAFEAWHRYWDLRRWRTAHTVLNHRFKGLQIILHYASGKYYFIPADCESFTRSFRQEHYYNPITTARINNNLELVENPLY